MPNRNDGGLPRSLWVLLAVMSLAWGVNWPMMKIVLAEVPVWTFRTLCAFGGAAGLLLIARAGGLQLLPARGQWGRIVACALFNIVLWNLLVAYGLMLLPAGRSVVIAYTMPLWAVLLAVPVLGEPLTAPRAAALLLGMTALALLMGEDVLRAREAPVGALLILAGAMCWAAGTVLVKRLPVALPTTVFTAWQLLLGGLPLLVGAWLLEPGELRPVSWQAAAALFYNIAVAFVFCYWAWYTIVAHAPAGTAALGTLLIPVVGVVSSGWLLGERVAFQELAALALVTTALSLVFLPSRQPS